MTTEFNDRQLQWGPVLLCGWPGLPGLWFRGRWSSLLIAIGFSILLNLALISSFVWRWFLGETFPLIAWPVIFLTWTLSALVAFRQLPDLMAGPGREKVASPDDNDTLFIQAQGEYLKGHWNEAVGLLTRQIRQVPRDAESRLLLATLFRHTRNFEHARNELRELEKFDEAVPWRFEIERERDLLELVEQDSTSADSTGAEANSQFAAPESGKPSSLTDGGGTRNVVSA